MSHHSKDGTAQASTKSGGEVELSEAIRQISEADLKSSTSSSTEFHKAYVEDSANLTSKFDSAMNLAQTDNKRQAVRAAYEKKSMSMRDNQMKWLFTDLRGQNGHPTAREVGLYRRF